MSGLALALKSDGERTLSESAIIAQQMQKRTDDSLARAQAAAAEAMAAVIRENESLKARLLAGEEALAATKGMNDAEKTALTGQIAALQLLIATQSDALAKKDEEKAGVLKRLYIIDSLSGPYTIRRLGIVSDLADQIKELIRLMKI